MNNSLESLRTAKKVSVSGEALLNVWLEEFFSTTIKEVDDTPEFMHPKDRRRFYDRYTVTQDQYDWWESVVIVCLKKKFGVQEGQTVFNSELQYTAPKVINK